MPGQVDSGKIDWIPQGRCLTQESQNREEDRKGSDVEAVVKLLQQQVRVKLFTYSYHHEWHRSVVGLVVMCA